MQQIFNILGTDVFVSLFIAMGLGIAIGVERYLAGKTAGVRTYTLVSMGSALFVIISQIITSRFVGQNFDPMRMAAQIIAAVGFLGVGAIFHKDNQV
ncbi:MAG TPA: MgtC/SapB family protein, partial [Candidatus Paceibacterota bacterium]|nr:MgtC/SapB family protein [Candidatus Paceibacterota bacterium]